jgi:rhodanese-related sulfurtransferase
MNDILKLLQSGARVVDVRTPGEYMDGHLAGSVNIPLNEIPARISEFEDPQGVVVCCASGIRSNKAANILRQHGINCLDGGSWLNLKTIVNVNA